MSGSVLRRNWPVILASAVVNLALLVVFETAQRGLPDWIAGPATAPRPAATAAAPQAPRKTDLERRVAGGKEGLAITVARQDIREEALASEPPAAEESSGEPVGMSESDVAEVDYSPADGPETPEYGAAARVPILRRNPATAKLRIGQFKSVNMDGADQDCLGTASGMLEDAGADRGLMKVLAETRAITIARICAENGSVVVTCRNNGMTISPRPKRPMDGCS